jgi:hypothetical protein
MALEERTICRDLSAGGAQRGPFLADPKKNEAQIRVLSHFYSPGHM